MTLISSFDRLVLGRTAPAILYVEQDNSNETIIASFHNFTGFRLRDSENSYKNTRAELREKDNEFALFLFSYPDSEVPDWWKNAKVIWSIG